MRPDHRLQIFQSRFDEKGQNMQAIVAVDENWAIGNKGGLLAKIPADMKRFRELTTGGVVVLGRKTIETFPAGKPLQGRTNIILSKNPEYQVADAIVAHNPEEVLKAIEEYDPDTVFNIGGESIYKLLLPYCDTALVTKIDHAYEADAYFPNLDKDPEWELVEESDEQVYFDLTYHFLKYARKK